MHRRLMCFAFMLVALAALALTGCSSDKRDNGGSSSEPATVTFKMFLEQKSAKAVAYEVESFKFTGFTDAEGETPCSHGAWSVDKDDSKLGTYQEIVFNDVPKNIVRFDIDYLDAEGNVLEINRAISVNLTDGSDEITIDGENNPPQEVCQVSVKFAEGFVVPEDAATYTVFVENDAAVIYTKTYDTIESPLPEAKFDLVPISATQVRVIWFDAEGAELSSNVETLPENLQAGVTYPVTISGDIPATTYSVLVKNIYQAEVADASNVSVSVIYASDSVDSDSAEGHNVVYNKDEKTCSFEFEPIGDNPKVLSITIADANFESPMAFEWLTYADGLALTAGTNELDVNGNEFAGGSGTEGEPYLVANPRQLDNVRNHLDASFKQIANIDFLDTCGITLAYDEETGFYEIDEDSKNENARFYNGEDDAYGFEPIGRDDGEFIGTYDGDNKTISHLVQYGSSAVGLFGYIDGASLKNITLDDTCYCAGPEESSYIGSLVAIARDGSNLESCSSESHVGGYYNVGGLVSSLECKIDESEVTIKECNFSGTVKGYESVGGIVSSVCESEEVMFGRVTFDNCVNSGAVLGYSNVGGICGYAGEWQVSINIEFTSCKNEGALQGVEYVAGILGQGYAQYFTFSKCTNSGKLTGCGDNPNNFGGIAGHISAAVEVSFNECTNTGKISEVASELGGIAGVVLSEYSASLELNSCSSEGSLSVSKCHLGGLMYYTYAQKISCNDCKVSATMDAGSSDTSWSGGMFGLIAYFEGLTFAGTNEVSGKISYGESSAYIGGAIGRAGKQGRIDRYKPTVAEVRAALKDVVVVGDGVIDSNEWNNIAKYCGYTWVDSLE